MRPHQFRFFSLPQTWLHALQLVIWTALFAPLAWDLARTAIEWHHTHTAVPPDCPASMDTDMPPAPGPAAPPSPDKMDHDGPTETHDDGNDQARRKQKAGDFLRSLLGKNLRVTTTDGRMFRGQFMCTDPESNIILRHSHEYREPSAKQKAEAAATAAAAGGDTSYKMDMSCRYLGLVIVPGQYIVKIQVEEFASQMKKAT